VGIRLLPYLLVAKVSKVRANAQIITSLLVDNQPRETTALRRQLEFAGFKTQVAHTGTGAINKIEEQPPDLVLLEVSLSDMDGLVIRNDSNTHRIPVLAMSAFHHMRDRCLQGGCDDFFQKPIRILDLVAGIRKSLR
jgi:DNA-binding response OmpR family regulator